MNFWQMTRNSYLYWQGNNGKVIISSHGGITYSKKSLSMLFFNLHFMVCGNRGTKGKVSSVFAMSSSELRTEPRGTSNVPDHELSHYPSDTQNQIRECVEEQGYDVVTIIPGPSTTLKSVLEALPKLNRYTDVYCLFCRNAIGKERKQTVSNDVLSELKQKFGK